MEEWIDSKRLYEGQVVSLRVGKALVNDSIVAVREVVEHPGGVVIVPVHAGDVIFIRQYRIAMGRHVIEIPAGKMEPGDTPRSRAERELEEETGFLARKLIPMGSVFASVGYTSEEYHLFLAFDLEKTCQALEFDENIEIVPVPLAEAERQVAQNEIKDAKAIIGVYCLLDYLRKHPEIRV
jgi:ADP-ribose pyrophosphatase